MRDGGSTSYAVFSGGEKFFLREIKPAFFDTAVTGADIQLFLQNKGFPVPPIILTNDNFPFVKTDERLYVLYSFIDGVESEPEQDAEAIGELAGKLHEVMAEYGGGLLKRGKQFYIGRYVDILRNRKYARAEEFFEYGEYLWEKIKNLPTGYCHGDMYCGNIHKTADGKLYILDFDTSCDGFPMYDPALICDMTDYFCFDEMNFGRSKKVLQRFIPEYAKRSRLSQTEADAFVYLIAVQHFSTQATVMEIFGHDCLNDSELDYQLEWLYRWRAQCEADTGIR